MSVLDAVLEYPEPSDIVIAYDSDNERFSVTSADTQCGYFVPRGDVVGNYRNSGEVIAEIMSGYELMDYELLVDVEPSAENEINLIWEANVVLFP
jgi:hypothetical protein